MWICSTFITIYQVFLLISFKSELLCSIFNGFEISTKVCFFNIITEFFPKALFRSFRQFLQSLKLNTSSMAQKTKNAFHKHFLVFKAYPSMGWYYLVVTYMYSNRHTIQNIFTSKIGDIITVKVLSVVTCTGYKKIFEGKTTCRFQRKKPVHTVHCNNNFTLDGRVPFAIGQNLPKIVLFFRCHYMKTTCSLSF
jgi:hypothetical protein